jgi:hypothetical protein
MHMVFMAAGSAVVEIGYPEDRDKAFPVVYYQASIR